MSAKDTIAELDSLDGFLDMLKIGVARLRKIAATGTTPLTQAQAIKQQSKVLTAADYARMDALHAKRMQPKIKKIA